MVELKGRAVKLALTLLAGLIAATSLLVSGRLAADLKRGEDRNMGVWAEAVRSLNMADEQTDLTLVLKVINGNNTIPVIVLGTDGEVQTYRNLGGEIGEDEASLEKVKVMAGNMRNKGHSIIIYMEPPEDVSMEITSVDSVANACYGVDVEPDSDMEYSVYEETTEDIFVAEQKQQNGDYIEICYDESLMLKRLSYYPYIQLLVVVVFVLIVIFALFVSMRAEQNKVWVGLSKETAHQLGTPISSLMAWSEVLKETYPDDIFVPEMEKDVKRLERIAERFSKIGSIPELKPEDLSELLGKVIEYMDHRTSSKVRITGHFPSDVVVVSLVAPLFEWVIENLCKNAVDAMDGSGSIDIYLAENERHVFIDVKDTGKGISKSHFKSVFRPGFTTKKRGWGLGLSLAKRVVEEYHKGKIYVKASDIGIGTIFRIELPKNIHVITKK